MNNRVPYNGDQSTPEIDTQVDGGGESRHSQHQWIVQSFNEMKEDSKRMNERIDQVYSHLSDAKNDASLACAITRMEVTLSGIEKQMGTLESINKSLSEHSLQLSGLTGIDKKLEKLDDIDGTVSKAKTAIVVGLAVIVGLSTAAWFVFGSYLGKIIEALNTLVLK
ncbi:hypothetical protein [Klebsiella aerogenes]|uniref:hypothetical protein n=1 Tax=Klebsiella aerogenes TaxID=548 RepID=UPI0034D30D50